MARSKQKDIDFISETKDLVATLERKFSVLDGVMEIEVDHFDKMVSNIRSMLDSLQKILQQTSIPFNQNQKYSIHLMLKEVELEFGCTVYISERSRAMTNLRSIEEQVYELFGFDPSAEGMSLGREIEIILRPKELEEIANMFLLTENSSPVSVFPILGMPGSGKTSLSYLLFHHKLCKYTPPYKKIWIRWKEISGVDSTEKIRDIILFRCFGVTRYYDNYDMDYPYLIVLDNLLIEEGEKWSDLLKPLLSVNFFGHGTKILVTSTSTSIEPHHFLQLPLAKGAPYLLEPINHHKSLPFFQRIAFRGIAEEDKTSHDLNSIAIEIFSKCNNHLHVIRILASILSSKPPTKWKYFNQVLLNIPNLEKHILSLQDQIMKHRGFFIFHSLFPLGYEFSKLAFYHIWEDVEFPQSSLKEKFEIFLSNVSLFECSKRDKYGVIVKYKVQVLAYEVAKHLARQKCLVLDNNSTGECYYTPLGHVNFIVDLAWKPPFQFLRDLYNFTTLHFYPQKKSCEIISIPDLNSILEICQNNLQSLDVAILDCRHSLDSIAKLKNLSYLRLGVSSESLPECITDLNYLRTLDLRHSRVRELPAGFHKLRFLRNLYAGDRLIDLPPKFGELTELRTLDVFIVGKHNGLVALDNFTHLDGMLKVRYQEGREAHVIPHQDAIILQDTQLHELSLEWPSSNATHQPAAENYQTEEAIQLELLQPPSTLKSLIIKCWKGEEFPKWAMDHFSLLLSNLVFIHIADCNRCTHLPSLSKLRFLKSLHLWGLNAVEWIENCVDYQHSILYFPSLENLSLLNLPMLKGWSRPSTMANASQQILPCLNDLRVSHCLDLISLPLMPNLQSLEVDNCHGDLLRQFLSAHATSAPVLFQSLQSLKLTSMSIPERLDCLTALEKLSLCWLYDLRILPESIGHLTQLCWLVIRYVPNLVDLPESLAGLYGLEHIEIRYCPRLKQIPRYFSQLVSLQKLKIKECVNLERRCQEPNGEDWPLIKHIRNVHMG